MPGNLRIRERRDSADDRAAWDEFARAHGGHLFHRADLSALLAQVQGTRPYDLLVESGGVITGILPLHHVRSRLFGEQLISVPYLVGGGPLFADDASRMALAEGAAALARRLGVPVVEWRCADTEAEGWQVKEGVYANFCGPLLPDPEARLALIERKKRRVALRKLIENGPRVTTGATVDQFLALYAHTMRDYGTPLHSRRWYAALAAWAGKDCEISLAWVEDRPVAAMFSFYHGDLVNPYFVGSVRAARDHGATDMLYWRQMERAAARGVARFDFGRSKYGTGAFDYKRRWGFAPIPQNYRYWLADGHSMPNANPNNPKFSRFVAAWQRLPITLTRWIGPPVARQIP